MIRIKSLSGVSKDVIYRAFVEAFADYTEPFNLSLADWQHMIERRGYNEDLSFAAFDEDRIVGFTLNGIGEWNNQLTAYDTGTGVCKPYRQQGIAARIFDESLPPLKKQGIVQYLLEVIRTNHKAVDLYKKAGFTIVREFDYFLAKKQQLHWPPQATNDSLRIKELDQPDWIQFPSFWDFQPSWQNAIASILRKQSHFTFLGAFLQESLIGYGIVERDTGDVPQLAVDPRYRRKGVATELLHLLAERSHSEHLKIINTWCESKPTLLFLKSVGLAPGPGQFEMIRML